jgi:asparagine synthase (glutamine-hydrolysing)
MAGIAGIIENTDKERIGKFLNQVKDLLSFQQFNKTDSFVREGVGLICCHVDRKERVFAFSDTEGPMLLLFGKIYDTDHLRKKLQSFGDSHAYNYDICTLLLKIYQEFGVRALCGLNGLYIIIIWEPTLRKLLIINDRHGFKKLYYWSKGKKFIFATTIKAIIIDPEFPKVIDEVGLTDFLTFGYPFEERTLFQNIKTMPAANILIFQNGFLSFEKYWDYMFHKESDALWMEEYYIDRLADVIKKAIKKRLVGIGQIAIPLSGGLDSRTIVGMLYKIGYTGEVITYSFGIPNAYDVIFGKQIADNLGYPHFHVPIAPHFLVKYSESFVWLTDGMICSHNSKIGVNEDFLLKHNIKNIANGFIGGPLFGSILGPGIIGLNEEEKIIRNLYYGHAIVMKNEELAIYLRREIWNRIKMQSYDSFRACYYRANTENPFFKSIYVDLSQRQRKYLSFVNVDYFGEFANIMTPFADHEVIDFNLRIPATLAANRNLFKKMIIKHLPEVASAPYTKTQLPLKKNFLRENLPFWRWERFWEKKLSQIIRKQSNKKINLQDYVQCAEAMICPRIVDTNYERV